jgi:hypothetical protein
MPVTVPIVSKKSLSMIAKIVRTAANAPRVENAWNRSGWNRVPNDGTRLRLAGMAAPSVGGKSVPPPAALTTIAITWSRRC